MGQQQSVNMITSLLIDHELSNINSDPILSSSLMKKKCNHGKMKNPSFSEKVHPYQTSVIMKSSLKKDVNDSNLPNNKLFNDCNISDESLQDNDMNVNFVNGSKRPSRLIPVIEALINPKILTPSIPEDNSVVCECNIDFNMRHLALLKTRRNAKHRKKNSKSRKVVLHSCISTPHDKSITHTFKDRLNPVVEVTSKDHKENYQSVDDSILCHFQKLKLLVEEYERCKKAKQKEGKIHATNRLEKHPHQNRGNVFFSKHVDQNSKLPNSIYTLNIFGWRESCESFLQKKKREERFPPESLLLQDGQLNIENRPSEMNMQKNNVMQLSRKRNNRNEVLSMLMKEKRSLRIPQNCCQ